MIELIAERISYTLFEKPNDLVRREIKEANHYVQRSATSEVQVIIKSP